MGGGIVLWVVGQCCGWWDSAVGGGTVLWVVG